MASVSQVGGWVHGYADALVRRLIALKAPLPIPLALPAPRPARREIVRQGDGTPERLRLTLRPLQNNKQ